jgi:hypothetical protein
MRKKIAQYEVSEENTYNMDEKGFLIGVLQRLQRVYSKEAFNRGSLSIASQDGNREWITCIASICMDGSWIPPTLIYQAQPGTVMDSWVEELDEAKHKVHFASSPTGWTNDDLGYEWLTTVFDRYTKQKARQGRDYRMLILDGHGSHVNMQFLDWCHEHRILVAVFPPHSTHRLQPLDVSLFGPLSQYYTQELDAWQFKSQAKRSLSKREFLSLFWPAFEKAFSVANIASGWAHVGLKPFDPNRIINTINSIKIKDQSRPSTSGTSSSALSVIDSKVVRRLAREVFGPVPEAKAKKLINTIEKLAAEKEILAHENAYLRTQFDKEKQKHQKGLNLTQQLRSEEGTGALIFSPTKISRAKEIMVEKEQEKRQKKKKQSDRKIEIALGKQRKTFDREQRELTSKLTAALKEKDSLRKQLGGNETILSLRTGEQSQQPKIKGKMCLQPTIRLETIHSDDEVEETGPTASLRSPRLRRQMRLPKRYDNCDMYLD